LYWMWWRQCCIGWCTNMACRALFLSILDFIFVCRLFDDLWPRPRQVGATTLEDYIFVVRLKYRVKISRVKTQGLSFVDCTWQWPCWRHYFWNSDFLQVKPEIFDQATIMFMHCSIFEGVAFGELLL
jgi:hypothetical protein